MGDPFAVTCLRTQQQEVKMVEMAHGAAKAVCLPGVHVRRADGRERASESGAQRACCAGARNAQRSWGPLRADFLLRAPGPRATRALRGKYSSIIVGACSTAPVLLDFGTLCSDLTSWHNRVSYGSTSGYENRARPDRSPRCSTAAVSVKQAPAAMR